MLHLVRWAQGWLVHIRHHFFITRIFGQGVPGMAQEGTGSLWHCFHTIYSIVSDSLSITLIEAQVGQDWKHQARLPQIKTVFIVTLSCASIRITL